MGSQRSQWLLLVACAARARSARCPGLVQVHGFGPVSLVPTGWNNPRASAVEVHSGGHLVPHMNARAYFAETCTAGVYSNEQYVALNLLGKIMRYTTDLSGAGCGCNVAFYLTSMRQNPHPSECSDYYCDANNVCGESCAEIDIQEANQYAWHSTLHTKSDRFGVGGGYGGGDGWNGARDWGSSEYGPGARCIDTAAPFQVAASFPVDDQGYLVAMEVVLSQGGRSCPLSTSLGNYAGMTELSLALQAGMTPVISYWSSNQMLWMDGRGPDLQGPCAADDAALCAPSARFYNFSIAKIGARVTPPRRPASTAAPDPMPSATARPGTAPPPFLAVAAASTPVPSAVSAPRPTEPPVRESVPKPLVESAPVPLPVPMPVPAHVPLPAPVPVPMPVPMPRGVADKGKIAIFQALGALCGSGSSVQGMSGTLLGYLLASFARLHTSPHQECIAVAAMLLGLTSAWDGPFFYRTLFTLVAAVAAACVADYEIQALGLAADQMSEGMMVVQIGTAAAFAAHHGFDGWQVLFGAALGLMGAHGCVGWVSSTDHAVHSLALFWYSMGAIFGCLIFTIWRHLFLKTLAPLVGGFLVATGGGAVASRIYAAAATKEARGVDGLAMLPSPFMDWATSASALLGTTGHGAVAGACGCALLALVFMGFGGQKRRLLAVSSLTGYIAVNAGASFAFHVPAPGTSWRWSLCGCILWAVVTAASAWRQLDMTEDWEIRVCVSDAMNSRSFLRRSDSQQLPVGLGGHDTDQLIAGGQHLPMEPSAPPLTLCGAGLDASARGQCGGPGPGRERGVALDGDGDRTLHLDIRNRR